MTNLFADIPSNLPSELFESLLDEDGLRIQRIVSHGHVTPPYAWYEQPQHEWIVLLKGEARLLIDGEDGPVVIKPGDALNIPAGQRHRVEWTTPDEPTIWLAVHYGDGRLSR